jgi:hypothetical protein
MDSVVDACVTLAQTGQSQQYIILVALAMAIASVGLLWLGNLRWQSHIVTGLCIGIFVIMQPMGALAQSAEECPPGGSTGSTTVPSGNEPTDDEGGSAPLTGFSLVNDFGAIQLPTEDNENTSHSLAILGNDQSLDDDPLNPMTIDLDPGSPGIQSELMLYHPDNQDYVCGGINYNNYGILNTSLNYYCSDNDSNTLIIPSDFVIEPFDYFVQSLNSVSPASVATVTIAVVPNPEQEVLAANDYYDHNIFDLGPFESVSLSILDNDTTSVGALVNSTIDLNPAIPGIQSSRTIIWNGVTFTATASIDGTVTIQNIDGNGDEESPVFYYTVNNTDGTVSNIAAIILEIYNLNPWL